MFLLMRLFLVWIGLSVWMKSFEFTDQKQFPRRRAGNISICCRSIIVRSFFLFLNLRPAPALSNSELWLGSSPGLSESVSRRRREAHRAEAGLSFKSIIGIHLTFNDSDYTTRNSFSRTKASPTKPLLLILLPSLTKLQDSFLLTLTLAVCLWADAL